MTLGNPDRPIGGLAVRPPPGVELRPIGRDDLAAAVGLAREARALPPIDPEPLRDRFAALLDSADIAPFVALRDGEPAGQVVLAFRRRLNFATFEGWLAELSVAAGARGMGIGRALLNAAVAEWQLRGAHRLLVDVASGQDACGALLSAAGFGEWMIDFRLEPVPPTEAGAQTDVRIRPLAGGDADAVTRLIAEFGPWRSPVPDRMDAVMRTFTRHLRDVEAGIAGSLVAEVEGKVVGVATLEWQRPFWDDRLQAWVPDLVVTEPMRGRGIGRALMDAVLRAAHAAGAAEVRLESGPGRETAHRLYRSSGFVETGRTWVKRRED
ncbi:MAG TPA: GNAT family N-acetyltransferase [Candidatus Limnocylindria bacterium]